MQHFDLDLLWGKKNACEIQTSQPSLIFFCTARLCTLKSHWDTERKSSFKTRNAVRCLVLWFAVRLEIWNNYMLPSIKHKLSHCKLHIVPSFTQCPFALIAQQHVQMFKVVWLLFDWVAEQMAHGWAAYQTPDQYICSIYTQKHLQVFHWHIVKQVCAATTQSIQQWAAAIRKQRPLWTQTVLLGPFRIPFHLVTKCFLFRSNSGNNSVSPGAVTQYMSCSYWVNSVHALSLCTDTML